MTARIFKPINVCGFPVQASHLRMPGIAASSSKNDQVDPGNNKSKPVGSFYLAYMNAEALAFSLLKSCIPGSTLAVLCISLGKNMSSPVV